LEPPILLLDEPFSSIDEPMREKLNIELLHICQKTQKTVVYVTHNLSEAILLGSQVFILSRLPATVLKVMEIELPDRSPKAITSSAFIQYLKVAREILEKTY
jgi:NitT/TauT family transport system ATP-binding protein